MFEPFRFWKGCIAWLSNPRKDFDLTIVANGPLLLLSWPFCRSPVGILNGLYNFSRYLAWFWKNANSCSLNIGSSYSSGGVNISFLGGYTWVSLLEVRFSSKFFYFVLVPPEVTLSGRIVSYLSARLPTSLRMSFSLVPTRSRIAFRWSVEPVCCG